MNVMRAAKAVKCRVVYASSSGTVGCSRRRGYVANDNAPYCDDIAQNWPYYKSKIESEIQSMEYARNNDIELMIMRPSMMLGPDDFYLRATKLIWNFLERKIPFTPLGGVSFVDVRDAADAFKAAMVVNRPNSTFLLGSKNCSIEDLFIILEQISGVPKPKLKLPAIVAKAASLALDTTNRKLLNKWDPGVDPVRVEMANHFWNIDWSKAMRELKFKPRSFEKTLADNINWLREAKSRGLVPDHAHPLPSAPRAAPAKPESSSEDEEGNAAEPTPSPPALRSKL
jgi:dihydroflavonol-4-reductase